MQTLYNYLLYFIIYAFLGWCAEVAFAAVKHGKFVNRGMLRGAYCPIYGFGVIIVTALLAPLSDNIIILFIGSAILTSLLELVTGFLLDKLFHRKWWDYSDVKFNIGGYICPQFSLLWGVACVLIVKLVHPFFAFLCSLIPTAVGIAIIAVFYILFIADVSLTIPEIYALREDIRLIASLESGLYAVSDKIGKDIYDKTVKSAEKLKAEEEKAEAAKLKMKKSRENAETRFIKTREKLELGIKEKLPDIKAAAVHKEKIKVHLSNRYSRLLKAFPDLKLDKNKKE